MRGTTLRAAVMALALGGCAAVAGAATGYESVKDPFVITRGTNTGLVTLAVSTFVPSVGVVGAPNPSIDWGDGTKSQATVLAPCFHCGLAARHTYTQTGRFTIKIRYYVGFAVHHDASTYVDVIPPSYTIAVVGDSVASGEGNPNHESPFSSSAGWDDKACHRSKYAGAVLAANRIQAENDITLRFQSLACSGATIGDADDGVVEQIGSLDDGVIDDLIVTVGANNIGGGFGSMIMRCLGVGEDVLGVPAWNPDYHCHTDAAFTTDVDADVSALEGKYARIEEAIDARSDAGRGPIGKVFLTEYYNPTRDASGHGYPTSPCTLGLLTSQEWSWFDNSVLQPLNRVLQSAAARHSWVYVGGIADEFLTHGYCQWDDPVSAHWVRASEPEGHGVLALAMESLDIQGDLAGTAHPNHRGHQVYADHLVREIYTHSLPFTAAFASPDAFTEISHRDVRITLAATNRLSASGIAATYYSVDGDCGKDAQAGAGTKSTEGCLQYAGAFIVGEPGVHTLTWFSVNLYGGFEEARSATFTIDLAPSRVTATVGGQPYLFGAWANGDVQITVDDAYEDVYFAVDDAGCTEFNLFFGCSRYSGPFAVTGEGVHEVTIIDASLSTAFSTRVSVRIDKAPPVMTLLERTPPNDSGWNNTDVTVVWSCSGPGSGEGGTLVSRVIATEGAGQTARATCTDEAGNTTSVEEPGIHIDKTAPTVSPSPARGADANGWYSHPLSVDWIGSDALSGLASCTPAGHYAGPDTASVSLAGHCTDLAGNVGDASHPLQYDATAPTITFVARTPANAAGWNRTDVTVEWSCADATSGAVASMVAETVTNEGAALSATGACADRAGNTASATEGAIRIDRTPPSVTAAPDRAADSNGWYNHAFVVAWPGTDPLSGIAACSAPSEYEGPDTGGALVEGSCSDQAGNSSGASYTFRFDATPPALACGIAPAILWPPNHTFVPATSSVAVTDGLSGPAGFVLAHRTSNEGDAGQQISGFAVGQPSASGAFLAERDGSGSGRIYMLLYTGADAAGNTSACTVTVHVPHDQRK